MKLYLARNLYADKPLWVVFWIYGVALSGVLIGLLFGPALYGKISLIHYLGAVCVLGVYTHWILASIWYCADRVKNKQWSNVARLLTVAWAINLAMVLFFAALSVVDF